MTDPKDLRKQVVDLKDRLLNGRKALLAGLDEEQRWGIWSPQQRAEMEATAKVLGKVGFELQEMLK